jgi:transcriptional regulator with XRE-family HTH domain
MGRDQPRPWSRWLRRYRDGRDLTQEQLGEVLGVDGKTISAWENGQRPGRRHARTICSRLGTTRAELGLAEAGGPVVDRRDFLRLGAGVGTLALVGPWAGADRVDPPGVDGFEAADEALWRLWMRAGAGATLGPALGHVEAVARLLQGSLETAARRRLCAVLAEGTALAALCKSWMGDPDGAEHFAAIAAAAAVETGDRDLAVHVLLVRTASDRRLGGRPELRRDASLDGLAETAAGPPTRAWAATLAAGAHAELGDANGCLRALDRAERLLPAGPGRRAPWPDATWLAGERGIALAELGRTAEARRALGVALDGTGAERAADRLRWALAAARAHLADGQAERAAAMARDVLRAARGLRHGPVEDGVARLELEMRS